MGIIVRARCDDCCWGVARLAVTAGFLKSQAEVVSSGSEEIARDGWTI